jgi:geranylgeranylglycerol-phosphate geranylgeranyltransferase
MPNATAFITIARPANVAMACAAVALGYWLGQAAAGWSALLLALVAAAAAVGFGNIVNDLRDIKTDRISHPRRPLAAGTLTTRQAGIFAVVLAVVALVAGFGRSLPHGVATVVPLALLALYAWRLKAVPLVGNILVALLVAYPLLYGGLGAPRFERLWLPALFAFLLNLQREIIKDLQDETGDRAAGLTTSAALPAPLLRWCVAAATFVYLGSVCLPVWFHQFGLVYGGVCIFVVLPLHLYRSMLFSKADYRSRLSIISLLLKLEMLAGLVALAADECYARFWAR